VIFIYLPTIICYFSIFPHIITAFLMPLSEYFQFINFFLLTIFTDHFLVPWLFCCILPLTFQSTIYLNHQYFFFSWSSFTPTALFINLILQFSLFFSNFSSNSLLVDSKDLHINFISFSYNCYILAVKHQEIIWSSNTHFEAVRFSSWVHYLPHLIQ
jgi:hypothetical protein